MNTTTPYWSDGVVTIYHGKCEVVLTTILEQVDVILTDPPYSEHVHGAVRSAKMMANDRGGVLRFGYSQECGSWIRQPDPRAARVLRDPVRTVGAKVGSRVL